jgi:hypothetical protein
MKKALISPNEFIETGYRVAEVSKSGFPVAPPLFWVDCEDSVTAEDYWYNPDNQQIVLIPVPELPPKNPVVSGVQTL